MADYWLTFRFEKNATYDERYNAFLNAVYKVRQGFWSEPTSFWLVESNLEIDAFCKQITAPLNAKTDLLVVRRISVDACRYFGSPENLDILKSFLPAMKKVA